MLAKNVLRLKVLMKEGECYKPNTGDTPQGGLGKNAC